MCVKHWVYVWIVNCVDFIYFLCECICLVLCVCVFWIYLCVYVCICLSNLFYLYKLLCVCVCVSLFLFYSLFVFKRMYVWMSSTSYVFFPALKKLYVCICWPRKRLLDMVIFLCLGLQLASWQLSTHTHKMPTKNRQTDKKTLQKRQTTKLKISNFL